MKLKIENIGKIKDADIALDGLTVIAGLNDTGKSTVGKVLFALRKSFVSYNEYYSIMKNNNSVSKIHEIIPKWQAITQDPKIVTDVTNRLYNEVTLPIFRMQSDSAIEEKISNFVNIIADDVKNIKQTDTNGSDLIFIQERLNDISSHMQTNLEEVEKLSAVMNKWVFPNVFCGNIINSLHQNDVGHIKLSHGDKDIVDINIRSTQIKINEDATDVANFSIGSKDVIFIDTPLIIENETILRNMMYHDDLKKKLQKSYAKSNIEKEYNKDIVDDISNIIKGEFVYENNRLRYKVSNVNEASAIELQNVAMGTKIFGIMNLLLRSGEISPNTMLILDEPENHLHPSWIVKLAEMLCIMTRGGFRILLTSHSPDFIQAINEYARIHKVPNVKFYLCDEPQDNYTKIIDNTDSIYKIFDNLTAPINKIFDMMAKEKISRLEDNNSVV